MKKLVLICAALVAISSQTQAQIGSAAKDLVFTPVTPCRIFDTRLSEGGTGAIATGGTKNFATRGVSTFASQGGRPTNCGLDSGNNIAAVAINITVISPTSPGYITAYPSNETKPLAATVNFKAGDILGNASVVKVSQAVDLTGTQLAVFSTSQTDVAGDVVGYYSKPVYTALQCTQPGLFESVVLPAGFDNYHYTTSRCETAQGYTAVSSYCYSASSNNIVLTGSGVDASAGAFCAWRNLSGASQTVVQTTLCCRIPGRAPVPVAP